KDETIYSMVLATTGSINDYPLAISSPPSTPNLGNLKKRSPMSWMEKDENMLLQRSFIFGMIGILFCMVPLCNRSFHFWDWANINVLTGIGIGVQLFALSIAVLVIRKRKISHEIKNKAQRMAIALTVALMFFFMI